MSCSCQASWLALYSGAASLPHAIPVTLAEGRRHLRGWHANVRRDLALWRQLAIQATCQSLRDILATAPVWVHLKKRPTTATLYKHAALFHIFSVGTLLDRARHTVNGQIYSSLSGVSIIYGLTQRDFTCCSCRRRRVSSGSGFLRCMVARPINAYVQLLRQNKRTPEEGGDCCGDLGSCQYTVYYVVSTQYPTQSNGLQTCRIRCHGVFVK